MTDYRTPTYYRNDNTPNISFIYKNIRIAIH